MTQLADMVALLLIGGSLAAIAWSDARQFLIPPPALGVLLAGGLLWQVAGTGQDMVSGSWAGPLAGATMGVMIVLVPALVASAMSRRWPLLPGDGALFGCLGWLMGPLGLAWTLCLGGVLASAHRICLQRKRGRPWRAGYAPLGPGMAAAAFVVWLVMWHEAMESAA